MDEIEDYTELVQKSKEETDAFLQLDLTYIFSIYFMEAKLLADVFGLIVYQN